MLNYIIKVFNLLKTNLTIWGHDIEILHDWSLNVANRKNKNTLLCDCEI